MKAKRLYLQAMSRALPVLSSAGYLAVQWLTGRLARRVHYVPRPDDIFIVSYPKSGTTLLQMMLYQMTTDGDLDFPHIDSVSPWFEAALRMGAGRHFEELPSPRVFKSHLTRAGLPRAGRFLYIARDLPDVALSAYHHLCLMSGRDVELGPFAARFLRRSQIAGTTWFRHLRSWWPHRDDPNVLFLLYDEVVGDLAGTVRRIADFCGLEVDERELPRIVERCGIELMKRHNEKFDPRLHWIGRRAPEFIREGRPGAGRRDLPAAAKSRLLAELDRLARDLGEDPADPHAAPLLAGGAAPCR